MRKKNRIRPNPAGIESRIKPEIVEDKPISFSFQYLKEEPDFYYQRCETAYFLCLIDKLKTFCQMTRKELRTNRSIRHHQIDFKDSRVARNSFGLPARSDDIYADAWQFELTVNEHGRLHGFFVGNVFHIVWLDPDHALYPSR